MSAETATSLSRANVLHIARRDAALRIVELADANEAGAIWRRIESRLEQDTLMSGWDWTWTWLDHYGDVVPHHFLAAMGPDGVCGIALVTRGAGQRRGPLPVRTRHLGTAGEPEGESACVEYNRLLVEPRYRIAFLSALIDRLRADRFGWDIVELNGFDPDEIDTLRAIEPGFSVDRRICYVADLKEARDNGKDIVDCLPKSVGGKVRKNLRRFEERFGPLQTEWVEDDARAGELYDELVELHQARWQSAGHPGSFASSRFRSFHRDLITRLLPDQRLVLFRVTAGEQMIGTFYGFVERGCVYHYQWGLSRFDDNALSPGFVVGALFMRDASERGYDELNWLAGDVRYKRDLSTTSRELVWAQWHRGPWAWVVDGLISLRGWQKARGTPAIASEGTAE